jgi:quercetin dioxygenase-like cupin family protein
MHKKKRSENMTAKIVKMAQIPILDSIEDAPGVETLEGRIGPLLSGFKGAAHYITMPPDMYCAPHKHSTESIIYTAKGNWVLCSEGQRHIMREGSLFFMPPNIATGYEVPFDKPATILIVKFEGPNNADEFISYLKTLKQKLEDQKAKGEVFSLSDLQPTHPARVYAAKLKY